MYFLLNTPNQGEQRRRSRDAELTSIRRNQCACTVLVILDHTETRRLQAKRIEHLFAHTDVSQTTVNQECIRQRHKFFVAVHITLHAAREHFPHGGIVVLPIGGTGNFKLAVGTFFRLSFDKYHHRTDRILSGKVGYIIRFQPQRQRHHPGHILQQFQRFMPSFRLFFAPFNLFARIFLRQSCQYAALAALRHRQFDFALRNRGQIFPDRILLLNFMRQQHGFRHCATLRIILLNKGGQHLCRIASSQVKQRIFLVLQGAARIVQHTYARARLSLHECDHVQFRKRTRDHMLPSAQLLHGAQAVTQHRRAFKLQFFRRFVHLFGQFFFQLLCIAFKQRNRLIDQRMVLLRTDLTRTGRTAAPQMQIEARAVFADVTRKDSRTGFEQQRFADRINCTTRRHAARIGAEITCPVVSGAGHNGKRRIRCIRIQSDVGIALVILQKDVILGLVFFYHRVFQNQCFKLAFSHDDVKIIDMADELSGFGIEPLGRLEVVGYAIAQQLGFADINDLAGFVLVQIHARLHRQTAHALLELFSCHGKPPPFRCQLLR